MSILSEFLTMLGVQDDFCIQLKRKPWKRELSYQTLISAMIHQYVEGDLVERRVG
ncbi:MAG: hypothetical protein BECKG1743D_GA0114223_102103 [Candidatus Kentron sp. G]|nr:MAG: hypothetical protein BECKG1743F_GA0114225_102272 [Candidatus Kentron sp. G]VFM98755.1 MAG: hypothetical protein BECKG1743E_GA0114224_102058 [Candidatus Kentron sp. G]VFN00601.1 MAG: hypothetical protein BECKG1743D_GA0114223_102103 [Candidatus Kentron sp. G]